MRHRGHSRRQRCGDRHGHRRTGAHPGEPGRATGRSRDSRIRSGSIPEDESGRPLMSADGGNPKVVEMKTREGEPKTPPGPPQPAAVAATIPAAAEPRPKRRSRRFIIMGIVPVILIGVGAWLWL